MSHLPHSLARKYAAALLQICYDHLSDNEIQRCLQVSEYLRERKQSILCLRLSVISTHVKQEALYRVCREFALLPDVMSIIPLLSAHRRLFLFPEVLAELYELYLIKAGIQEWTFAAATELLQEDLTVLQTFLARHTGRHIIYKHIIDQKLIAGIRLQSTTFLWEHSIAGQLRNVECAIRE